MRLLVRFGPQALPRSGEISIDASVLLFGLVVSVAAQASDVTRLVLAEAGGLALVGVTLGIGAALALTRQLQAILFETSPLDPAVFVAVSGLLIAVCLLASSVPTRRATRVDPMAALRVE